MLSLAYFTRRTHRRGNCLYFRNLYMVITLVDLLISVFIMPVVITALSDRGSGLFGLQVCVTVTELDLDLGTNSHQIGLQFD